MEVDVNLTPYPACLRLGARRSPIWMAAELVNVTVSLLTRAFVSVSVIKHLHGTENPPFMLYPVIMRYCFKEHGEPCNSPLPPPPPQKKGYKQIEYTEYFELRIIFSLSVFLRLSYVLFVYIFVCYLFCLF